jgi:hypothetical protein
VEIASFRTTGGRTFDVASTVLEKFVNVRVDEWISE